MSNNKSTIKSGPLCTAVLMFFLLFCAASNADAISTSCPVGSVCDFHLTQSNSSGFDESINFLVHVDNTGAKTVITVALDSIFVNDLSKSDLLGIDKFGYNGAIGFETMSSGWSECGGQGNLSAFGRFSQCAHNGGSTDLNPSFTLDGLVTSFSGNSPQDSHFALHARFKGANSCGAFAGDSNVDTRYRAEECQSPIEHVSIPEPPTLFLLGAALLGLGIAQVKRRANGVQAHRR